VVDPAGLARAPDLRGLLEPLELLGERPAGVVENEDPVGIRVDRRREPDGLAESAEPGRVAGGVLLGPGGGGQYHPVASSIAAWSFSVMCVVSAPHSGPAPG